MDAGARVAAGVCRGGVVEVGGGHDPLRFLDFLICAIEKQKPVVRSMCSNVLLLTYMSPADKNTPGFPWTLAARYNAFIDNPVLIELPFLEDPLSTWSNKHSSPTFGASGLRLH